MPYISLSMLMDETQKTEGWQLNVAVAPLALTPGSDNDKREVISAILEKITRKYRVDARVFVFEEKPGGPNGEALHGRALEGLHRGKEIVLSLPNQDKAFSNLTYERLVLELWSALHQAGVPLQARFIPGTYPISGPDELPTPFSVSRSAAGDLNERHGELFQEAIPVLPPYPLTTLKLTPSALAIYHLNVNTQSVAQSEHASFVSEYSKARRQLANDFKTLKQTLWPRPKPFQTILQSERLAACIQFFQKDIHKQLGSEQELLTLYPDVKRLLIEYPHAADNDFSLHPAILELRTKRLSAEQIGDCLKRLKDNYPAELAAIQADYRQHTKGNKRSARAMAIDWSFYFPDGGDDEITQLIEHFPAAMQSLYRRAVWLERERQSHEQFKKQWLKRHYSSSAPYRQLSQLAEAIQQLRRDGEVNPSVIERFSALHAKIEGELFAHPSCNLADTAFPIVLDHFTDLARCLHSKPGLSREEISLFACRLDEDLSAKRLSIGLRVCIAGCIGALLGLVIGFAVGAALTWWGGGFGAIPAAIAGMTLAEGLVIGGIGLAAGVELGAAAAAIGFFSTKAQEDSDKLIAREKQRNKETLLAEMDDVIDAINEQEKPFQELLPSDSRVIAFQ
ncbi:hypothetical protein Lrub_0913 [Legionella rubrilucens]|uniref:Uncharacterized protein n=1 Tax=Legionella rubrilucens TaxID=458 RepID=A0A0W0XVT4_9GAMM|nr:hypothetical protein [Legionella rubrilucens]KTD48562.1 hypothetical protein Lrub_0913 [Legionella rubrilucens]